MRTPAIALLLAVSCAGSAGADVLMLDENTTVDELRSYLAPEPARRTRGIEIVGQASAAPSMAAPASAVMPAPQAQMQPAPEISMAAAQPAAEPTTVGFRVQFAYNSAEIEARSRPFLDQLGQVLQSEPNLALVVEGHTDGRGSEAYNQVLSLRRAEAVKAYLAQTWQVPAVRLTVAGKGESEPLTADPNDGENRRVQFRPV